MKGASQKDFKRKVIKQFFVFCNCDCKIFISSNVNFSNYLSWWYKMKYGPGKICGRQRFKKLKWYGLFKKAIYYFKIFKGCVAQILHCPFLNTSSQIILIINNESVKWVKMLAKSIVFTPFLKVSFALNLERYYKFSVLHSLHEFM